VARHIPVNYGGGTEGATGEAVAVGAGVSVNVEVGGATVNVEVGGCVFVGGRDVFVGGRGVLVGAATTMETVSVDPNTVPV